MYTIKIGKKCQILMHDYKFWYFKGFPCIKAKSNYVLKIVFYKMITWYIPQGPSSTSLQKLYPTSFGSWYNLTWM